MKNNIFCNNCGKQGHVFHSCKLPIISNGIIVYRENKNITDGLSCEKDKYEYLMIQRKDTLGYVDFLRGRYSLYNKLYLMNIINEMTIQEKVKIRSKSFDELWTDLWCGISSSQYKNEGRISKEKFDKLKTGITINNNIVTLESLIKESKTRWIQTEWGFPKGRRNYNEKDLNCAIREFEEETGYQKDDVNIIYNILPYEEIFTGSNFKSYKHKYFICKLKEDITNNKGYQKSEVSDMKWKSFSECLDSIRPYNLEKKDIITKLDKVLNEFMVI